MHQQVRVSTKKDAPGAQSADEGGLLDILELLERNDINLRLAGGHDLSGRGMFVFAVDHDLEGRCVDLLREAGYRDTDVHTVHDCTVRDEKGALADCIRKVHREGLEVDEIFVGTPGDDGIPLQITTRGGASASF